MAIPILHEKSNGNTFINISAVKYAAYTFTNTYSNTLHTETWFNDIV